MLGILSVLTSSAFAGLTAYLPRSETGKGFFEYYLGIMVHNPTYAFSAFMFYGGMLMTAASVTGLIVISIMELTRGAGEF